METITLNNGVKLPALGFGVFQTPPDETRDAVRAALEAGYRHVDTAAAYGNERQVGEAVQASGLDRSEVFLETKIWISDYGYDQTLHGFDKGARKLSVDRSTVIAGMKEVAGGPAPSGRVRAPGAGPKTRVDTQPGLLEALDELVHPQTRGNPMSLLRWTSKSTAKLARDLVRQGFEISDDTVGRILKRLGYSLQSPAKVKESTTHPDRDGQFRYLHRLAQSFVADGDPVISVDTKKKELVGEYANGGVEYQPTGEPARVNVHDFVDPELGRAIPYGIYDETHNEGWVSVGDIADTAEFAVNSIRSWWNHMGRARFPDATRLLITADGGGSNGHRVRAWKAQLARLATETGLDITVCHYPPGTSKWNRIEHRMFSFITMNWRGRPLTTYRTIIELISATTTETGLKIRAERDTAWYATGVKITDTEMAALPLTRHDWHGDWNYTLTATPNA